MVQAQCRLVLPSHLFYIAEQMKARDPLLGPLEQLVLLAVLRIGSEAYGMTIRREVEERTGRRLSIGAVYTALDRLLRKGYVRSHLGAPTTERGGRAKRHFRITARGEGALRESQSLLQSMSAGLELGLERK